MSGVRPPLLSVRGLTVEYSLGGELFGRGKVRAAEEVSFILERGRTLGLVGESGSGKSTVGRAVAGLVPIAEGSVELEGVEVGDPDDMDRRTLALSVQMLFQDPWGSLNPRMTAGQAISEGPVCHRLTGWAEKPRERTDEVLARVGLPADAADRYPHEFSGGQRQRVALARALAMGPVLMVLDEPTSALDVSMAAQILNLLSDLQRAMQLGYLLIGHDLSVVEKMADDIAVMYAGQIVEAGPSGQVLGSPAHPYTRMLIETALGHRGRQAPAEAQSPAGEAGNCRFASRCSRRRDTCEAAAPGVYEISPGHTVRCDCRE